MDAGAKRNSMKAITLYQPWASALFAGLKTHETRSWRTNYRGTLIIHASKSVPKKVWSSYSYTSLTNRVLRAAKVSELPEASIIGCCQLVDCVPTEDVMGKRYPYALAKEEVKFGDYSPGRFAWRLEKFMELDPIPCRGARGLWTPTKRQLDEMTMQLLVSPLLLSLVEGGRHAKRSK